MRIPSVAGLSLVASLCGYGPLFAANATFEVASAKISQVGKAGGEGSRRERVSHTPNSLTMANVTLKSAVQYAYNVRIYQVTGPAWLDSDRFDITGKAAAEVPENDLREMLQSLLGERFKLAVHREEKILPVYALQVGKDGPKFKESTTEGEMTAQPGPHRGSGTVLRLTVAQAVDLMSQPGSPLGRPVVDETGLKGKYDVSVDLSAYLGNEEAMKQFQSDPTQLFMAVLHEQLGLKLEPKKVPIQMVVVDTAEKVPTEN